MEDKPVVLFTSPVLRHPPVGGPTLRIENSIKALSQVCRLHVYSRVALDALGGRAGLSFYKQYCTGFYFAPLVSYRGRMKFVKRAADFVARRMIKRSMFRLACTKTEDLRPLLDVANAVEANVIWLGYGNISYPLLKYIKRHSNYKVVVDTDSALSRSLVRGLAYEKNDEQRQQRLKEATAKAEEERWGTQLADVTTAVSEVDADYYRGLANKPGQISTFSNVIDPGTYQLVPARPESLRKPCIYLAGTFWSRSPMEDAARWVIRDILPLARKKLPSIHLYVVGAGSDRALSDIHDQHITVTGQLPSVLPYLCHADVALVPLRWESGTRFKILEAGACGIPVVSTTLGAEGIPVSHERDILIADEPELFADSIVRLVSNREFASTIANNLKKLVYESYTISSLASQGRGILEYLQRVDPVLY